MAAKTRQEHMRRAAWRLSLRQHGVIARRQLLDLGFSSHAIKHRLATGRLHPVRRGVYAVGRPTVGPYGRWMAALLACGGGAAGGRFSRGDLGMVALSHFSAAALWGIGRERDDLIEVSLLTPTARGALGLRAHRRPTLRPEDLTTHRGVPVTSPIQTLIDLSLRLDRRGIERAINEADKYDLVHPPELRRQLEARAGERGVAGLCRVLDRRTFRLTRDELERRFLPLARRAGLPPPLTLQVVNGFEVDFFWPQTGLVVETDGLRYHRTPAEQSRDRLRDQVHTAAGLTTLRFTHEQVRWEPRHVRHVLADTWLLLQRRLSLAS